MKKLLCVLLCAVLLLPVLATAEEVVNVYNWEDYIDESVLQQFEEETGIKVNYMRFTDNEGMITQVETNPGAFDVVFPSEYCVERMVNENLLLELDYSKIPNFQYIRDELKDPSYDPQNAHSVPYMCGTLGILYNTSKVDEADVHTWSVLWNQKYAGEVLMMDSLRDAMGVALKYLGYSMNTENYMELREATDLLISQKTSGMVKAYGLDEFKDKMVQGTNGEASLALVYSGDAEYAIEEGAKKGIELAYCIPDEGSNVWVDCAVIPASARNVENAYAFINFLCRPDIAAKNVEEIWYMSVNSAAIEEMGEEYSSLYALNPTEEDLAKCEYYNALDSDVLKDYNDLYQEVKNAR